MLLYNFLDKPRKKNQSHFKFNKADWKNQSMIDPTQLTLLACTGSSLAL